MGKSGRKKKGDDDVLRAEGIVPPYGDDTAAKGPARKAKSTRKASPGRKVAKKKAKRKTAKSAASEQEGGDIPQLNLEQQILARQRKVTSVRRKAPDGKSKTPARAAEAKTAARRVARPAPQMARQDRIIAEIVARDIERLCKR